MFFSFWFALCKFNFQAQLKNPKRREVKFCFLYTLKNHSIPTTFKYCECEITYYVFGCELVYSKLCSWDLPMLSQLPFIHFYYCMRLPCTNIPGYMYLWIYYEHNYVYWIIDYGLCASLDLLGSAFFFLFLQWLLPIYIATSSVQSRVLFALHLYQQIVSFLYLSIW